MVPFEHSACLQDANEDPGLAALPTKAAMPCRLPRTLAPCARPCRSLPRCRLRCRDHLRGVHTRPAGAQDRLASETCIVAIPMCLPSMCLPSTPQRRCHGRHAYTGGAGKT